jgi:hypothetical protein
MDTSVKATHTWSIQIENTKFRILYTHNKIMKHGTSMIFDMYMS